MNNKYDNEEMEILENYNNNKLIQSKTKTADIMKAKEIANNTINKSKHISIRLSEKDLTKLKAKSLESGVAYQTLIGILIRQYTENKIKIEL
ncbi:MAG TPA: antitoxin [Spirochaetota bacterium]|jgi:predicted DNA binding CopG/RHH family protein|nr:MAG: hypothetical protein BWX91_01912 [Spirochaetes bacterium ADurb.Bin133]HNZ26593.1 antitoxin [Spirochaetota bacterium]HOF00663.1 antitoxin [Spirochaetota bacterium]HOS32362.1 antitoxin [Spirochaetota bacterium]HOS55609.1 antitoxin [Spirochaetota bacterium]